MPENIIHTVTALFTAEGRILKRGYQIVDTEKGERLAACPERTYAELFSPVTEQVLNIIASDHIAVVGGVSGSGKTELLLRDNGEKNGNPLLNAGGIVQRLNREGMRYFLSSFHSAKIVRDAEAARSEGIDIFLFDESTHLYEAPAEDELRLITSLLHDGKKIVLVGGGGRPGSVQCSDLKTLLDDNGVHLQDRQLIDLKPTILTLVQAASMLQAKGYSAIQANALVAQFVKQSLPLTVRVMYSIPAYEDQVIKGADINTFDFLMSKKHKAIEHGAHAGHLKVRG